jgi:hypothetical protein
MKRIILFLLFIVSSLLNAATLSSRINGELDVFETKLGNGSLAQKVNNLVNFKARKDVFYLQVYGRLFNNDFNFLKKFQEDFKELEDTIGQVQKWSDLQERSVSADNIKSSYSKNQQESIEKLNLLLKKWEKEKIVQHYRKLVNKIDLNEGETTDLSLERIRKETKNIAEKNFDFTYGETGLHELRRSLRWPVFEFELFKDLYSVNRTTNCSSSPNNLFNIGLQESNLVLAYNPKAAKEVDYCSYVKILGAVELLGQIKDSLEQQDILNDKLPKELRKKIESIYNEIVPEVIHKLF